MPNITRGERMGGLLVYLAGPGRHNEHTDPHLVAGDPAVMAWHDDAGWTATPRWRSPGSWTSRRRHSWYGQQAPNTYEQQTAATLPQAA